VLFATVAPAIGRSPQDMSRSRRWRTGFDAARLLRDRTAISRRGWTHRRQARRVLWALRERPRELRGRT
jgi:hypothetical protein